MAQSLARLWTHLIFSTKERFPFLRDKSIRADMHAYLATVLRNHGCETLIAAVLTIMCMRCFRSQETTQLPQ